MLAKGIRLSAWFRQTGAQHGAIGIGMALLAVLIWVGHPQTALLPGVPLRGLGMPHLSSEALRLLALLGLAWGFYRYGDLPTSRARRMRGVLACVALVAAGWSALVATGDRGPLQVAALHMALVLLSGLALLGAPAQPALHRMALTALTLVGTLGVFWWGQTQLAPRVSATAAERAWARVAPEQASSSNYLQTRWLLDAATPPGSTVPQGFGLGTVPFCGARPWLGVGPCTLTSGSPIQLPSDFPVVGLIATFGLWPTAAMMGLLLLWLRLMARGACAGNRTNPVDRLRAWLVSLLALSLGIQTLLSVAGGLGWSLLTGITLPLLGYGQTSLQVLALAAGLALVPQKSALSNPRL
jgi:cell division protein FtsW (lipid II flippase)